MLQLLGMIYPKMRAAGITDELSARCRQQHLLNRITTTMLLRCLTDILPAFEQAGVDVLLLKGAALIPVYYQDLGLRPVTDIDIAVGPTQLTSAMEVLRTQGWRAANPRKTYDTRFLHSVNFEDSRKINIDLHCHPLHQCLRADMDEGFWRRAVAVDIGTSHCLRLDIEDQLIHALAHGSVWVDPPAVRWVADAIQIITKSPRPIDWRLLQDNAVALDLSDIVASGLNYLRAEFSMPIPDITAHPVPFSARHLQLALATIDENSLSRSFRYHTGTLLHAAGSKGVLGAIRLLPAYLRSLEEPGQNVVLRYIRKYTGYT